jgi:hypothetical protein
MDVGNDPFPREEVTGLAAFENLEPVSSLSVEPEPELQPESEAPPPPPHALQPTVIPGSRAFQSPDTAVPFGAPGHPFSPSQSQTPVPRSDGRGDPTMPLDLTVDASMESSSETSNEGMEADELFDRASSAGWDDPDEATRVVTPSMMPVGNRSADLQMDWDEDEPPTRMRSEGMLDDMPPALGLPMDWDDASSATQIYDNQDQQDTAGFAASDAAPAATTLSGGRPSPFPSAPRPLASVAARTPTLGAPSPFATTAVGRDNWTDALRGGDRRTWIWAAAGALGLIVLALLTRALVGGTPLGTVTVATNPSDARVLIDGHAVSGTSSPFAFSDVAAGKHEIVVSKTGFVDYHGSFALGRGETKTLPTVELVPSVREVGFSVRSAPPGAEVWVDGHATDQLTPAKLTGITPGIHRLQLKRAGYGDFELQMFVPEATVLQLPTAELTPVTTSSRPLPRAATVVSAAPAAQDGSALERRKAARAARLAARSATPAVAPSPFSSVAPRSAAPISKPLAAAPAAASGHGGTLRINSRPWAQVFVDGRLVGNTPQPALQLNAGNHQIKLVNQPMGLTKSFSVSIKAGQMVTKVLNLAE